MVSLLFPHPSRWWWRLWHADRFASFRFYGSYFRWPFVLAILALVVEKAVFYGGLPLVGWSEREWSYLRAEHDFAAGRDEEALVRIREALLVTRDNAKLWRLAGHISDRLGSPEAPYCWEQADQLEPGSAATELALADSSLRHQEWALAAAALHEMPPEQQGGVDFLVAAGRLAAAGEEPERARYFFERAQAQQPRDPEALFALADWRTGLGTSADAERARLILTGLATQSGLRLRALRQLVVLELGRNDFDRARQAETELVATAGAGFADRIHELDLARTPDEVDSIWHALLGRASRLDAATVLVWMAAHGRAEDALVWIRRQEEAWQDDPGIGLARARCLAALEEWTHLRDDQRDSTWPGHESTRLMLLAEASWQLGAAGDATSAWHRAVAACALPDDFSELTQAAETFPEAGEARAEVWLALANRFPGQQWPLRRLLRYELARGDLVLTRELADRLTALAPDDAAVAATRDLLDLLRGTGTAQATADLVRLDTRAPDDPTVATAAAYSLYLDGHFDDALAAIGTLAASDLRAPERAVYVGQLLAAAGPVDEAEEVLRAAEAQALPFDERRGGVDRALDLVAYRRAMVILLSSTDAAARRRAGDFFLNRAPAAEPVFMIGAAVALLPDQAHAAGMLARIDPSALDRVELEIYEGAVLAVTGDRAHGTARLQLANGLPAETSLGIWEKIVDVWWGLLTPGSFDPSIAAGLLTAYRGLESAQPPDDFWLRDEPRELQLTGEALRSGALAEPVQARLEALLRHVPATPELEAQVGYALFLQGRAEAGRQRLEVLNEKDRRRPGPAGYYAAILQACGETKEAAVYARLAVDAAGLERKNDTTR